MAESVMRFEASWKFTSPGRLIEPSARQFVGGERRPIPARCRSGWSCAVNLGKSKRRLVRRLATLKQSLADEVIRRELEKRHLQEIFDREHSGDV